jgi:3-deoxy-D-manno-octulosonate 8-phosphate phosphatase (KDO 8-P phosphatase)
MTQLPTLPSKKLKRIKMLLLDVDGVLTDGSIIYNDTGIEIKPFNAKDGLGIRLLAKSKIQIGIVTGRKSQALLHRCQNLGIDIIFDGIQDKTSILELITEKYAISSNEIAFVGDDLPDLPLMKRVGLSIAVGDAHPLLMEKADMTTTATGGKGAVREVCEEILKAKGLWEKTLEHFLQ